MRGCALVTGSSRGIGRAIARRLAKDGWPVCVNYYQNQEAGEKTAREIRDDGGKAIVIHADVSNQDAVKNMIKTAETELGSVELVINNAGIAGQVLFQDITDEIWNRFFDINLNGARRVIQAVLPDMIHAKHGNIINISSIWGLRGASCESAYACTKAGLIALTRSLALELAPSGIRVNCIAPGVINTDMVQVLGQDVLRDLANQTPLGRLGTPEDIADLAAFLASDQASFLTGQVITSDGGFIL